MTFRSLTFRTRRGARLFCVGTFLIGAATGVFAGIATVFILTA
jgi:hypothetical protein